MGGRRVYANKGSLKRRRVSVRTPAAGEPTPGLSRPTAQREALQRPLPAISHLRRHRQLTDYFYGPGDRRLVTFETVTGERVFRLRGQGDEVLREYQVNGWGTAGSGSPGEGWFVASKPVADIDEPRSIFTGC